MSNISSRPHIRAKKMDAWKQAAPLSGYLQWRDATVYEYANAGVLHGGTHISVLHVNGYAVKNAKVRGYHQAFAGNPLHDADVKFFDGTFRVRPNSSFLSSKPRLTPSHATLRKSNVKCENEFKPRDGDGKPIILLIGLIFILVLYLVNTSQCLKTVDPRSTRVEFFDCRGSNVSLTSIKRFSTRW